ncbi:MAG: hypothetical protein CSA49_02005 [Gammaproteobacteria bacterium]|nr:MAG: hypothetical protein CSA49_02005 [Gammaproteobacteria bacterium]
MKKTMLLVAGTLLPLSSFAHPGHDHSHWTSPLAHGILFVSIVAVAALGVKLFKQQAAKKAALAEKE